MAMWGPLSAGLMTLAAAIGVSLLTAGSPAVAADDVVVAGLHPDRRPENAPVLKQPDKSARWYASATAGVSQPIPPSLRFLDDQGNWFTPFTHPGMVGRYDIRGLHSTPSTK